MTAPSVLVVTRAFPPIVGGMEMLSAEFAAALGKKTKTWVVANRYGKRALPWFLPWAAFQILRLAPRADVIHLGDPLITLLLLVLPVRKPVTVMVHGLDILYPSPLYQALLRRAFPKIAFAFCISRFVEQKVQERFPSMKTVVLTPGHTPIPVPREATRERLAQDIGQSLPAGPLLLTVARLVRRKGIAWFVEHVLPQVPDATLLVIGDGPERQAILDAAQRKGVHNRVVLAGRVPDDTVRRAYAVADLFVMPNIPVRGDAEGFGLVALEAAAAGLPVVASHLEGIPDAVIPNETGVLVPPLDATAWSKEILRLLRDSMTRQQLSNRALKTVRERFSWNARGEEAMRVFRQFAQY